MAFNLQYLPDPLALAGAANASGLGDFSQQERDFAMRYQAMQAQRASEQARLGLAERQFSAGQDQQQYENAYEQQRYADAMDAERQQIAAQEAADQRLRQLARNEQLASNGGGGGGLQNRLMGYFDRMMGDQQGFDQDVFLRQMGFGQQNALQERGIEANRARDEMQFAAEDQRYQSELELKFADRNEARARAEWLAVQEDNRAGRLSPEQFADARQQVLDKFNELGLPPPIGGMQPEQKTPGQLDYEEKQKNRAPGQSWVYNPKTDSAEVASGWRPEMDPVYVAEEHKRQLELIETQNRKRLEELDRTERQQERTFRMTAAKAELDAEMAILKANAPKRSEFTDAMTLEFDDVGWTEAETEFNKKAESARQRYRNAIGESAGSPAAPLPTISSKAEFDALPPETSYIWGPTGTKGTKR